MVVAHLKFVTTESVHMSPPPLQPTVAVALYRALLRTCRNGRHPEVFHPKAAAAYVSAAAALDDGDGRACNIIIPSDAKSVRRSIRQMFDIPLGDIVKHGVEIPSPFEVLREASTRSLTLLPSVQALPTKLPLFDYEHAALLPGEQTSFRFFEPRYKRLVEAATEDGGDGWFLLRMRLPYYSILARITEHATLPNGDYGVNCAAGPRVSVLVEDSEAVALGAPQLAWAVEYELKGDDVIDGEDGEDGDKESLNNVRQRCLDLLLEATTMENIASVSMPPLDPEAFSFYALRFVLGDADVSTRMKWLACRSTSRRLLYVIDLLESFQLSRESSRKNDLQCSSFWKREGGSSNEKPG